MPVAEIDPFSDLIGGQGDAPAYQTTGGEFREVPRATLNALPAPETDPFGDLVSNAPEDDSLLDVGKFYDLLPKPPKPETRTEEALLETPAPPSKNPNGLYIQPGSLPDRILTWLGGGEEAIAKSRGVPTVAERPPLALPIAKAVDAIAAPVARLMGDEPKPVMQGMVEERTKEPEPGEPSFLNAGIPMIPPQEGTAEQIAAGVANVPIGFANFLLSPGGVTTLSGFGLLPKAGQVLAGLGFTAEQVKGFFEATTLQDKITSAVGAALLGYGTVKGEMARRAESSPQRSSETALSPENLSTAEATTVPRTQDQLPSGKSGVPIQSEVVRSRPEITPESSANARQIEPGTEAAISELQRRNAPSTEPVIPKEPAGTKFAEPVVDIPENLRRNPEIDRLINEPEAQVGDTPTVPIETQAGSLKLRSNKEGGFVNAELLTEAANLGKRIYQKGMDFARWSAEMVRHLGDSIKTHLKMLWDSLSGADFLPGSTEGGALFSGGGKRRVTPKGTTPRGDTEFLKIESGPKRILKGLEREGAADIIGRSKNKVGKLLSEGTNRQVDLEQELTGKLSSEFERAHKGISGSKLDKAYDEIAVYEAAEQNGRTTTPLSKDSQKLLTAWENVAESSGKIMAANDVQVRDPATGNYRPTSIMGRKYRPRMFKAEVERVMRDPDSNATLFNELVSEVQKHRGMSEVEASNYLRSEAGRFTSSGFMGAIDMARTTKLPEVFYEYDLRNLAARYIPAFSERMAQIISYGQRLGPKEQSVRKNLWDIAREEAGDVKTKELLNVIEDQSINLRPTTFGSRAMSGAQTAATGLYLSAPTTTLRNLLSGLTATPELLGTRRSAQAIGRIIKNRQAFADAREIGVIRDSIATTLHADKLSDSFVHDVIRGATDKALKYFLHSGSESFVRTHGFVTADIFARDAVKALNKRPTSMRSKEALGLFKRMGVNAEKIVAENGEWRTGPETRKFIRTFVRETQGGYRFNQVPLWASSNNGRFLYQFGRWGAQRARNIQRNAIRPAIGETVTYQGKTMSRRDLRPLLKMAITPILLGEAFGGIAQLLFGRDRRDASLSEIAEAFTEDQKEGLLMAGERIANDIIMAGTLGIWSTPLDWAKSFKDQSRLKNPAEPPGLGSITALKDLGQKAFDQNGEVTRRDVVGFLSSFAPGIKQGHDIQRNIRDEPLYEAENDVKTLRNAAHRWGKQTGLDVAPRAKGNFRKSALAPEYEPIKEALLVGDSQRAKFLTKAFLDRQPNRSLAKKNLKMSIRMSQPFRAGPYNAKRYRDDFKEWAKKNLSEQDWQQTERIQERYQRAAVAAELW